MNVEVSVLRNGLCCHSSPYVLGSIAHITIFLRSLKWYKAALKMQEIKLSLPDIDIKREEQPDSWSVLSDKGYQGLQREIRAIHPIQKPPGGRPANEERMLNVKGSSNRVVVERCFSAGRCVSGQ